MTHLCGTRGDELHSIWCCLINLHMLNQLWFGLMPLYQYLYGLKWYPVIISSHCHISLLTMSFYHCMIAQVYDIINLTQYVRAHTLVLCIILHIIKPCRWLAVFANVSCLYHSLVYLSTYLLTESLINSPTQSLTHSRIHPPIHLRINFLSYLRTY